MANRTCNRIRTSDLYKYVQLVKYGDKEVWRAEIQKYKFVKTANSEKEAAIQVDLKLIEMKESPINCLKRR